MISKITKSSNTNILCISFALMPALLVSGPLLSEICIIFLISALLYYRIFNLRNLNLFKFSCYFFVFYLSINISSFFSPDIFLSLKSSFNIYQILFIHFDNFLFNYIQSKDINLF